MSEVLHPQGSQGIVLPFADDQIVNQEFPYPDISIHSENLDFSLTAPEGAPDEVVQAFKVGLPPREFWLLEDPRREKIDTPLNRFGLVDEARLIHDVKATISADYAWPGESNRHHKYWTARDYYEEPYRSVSTKLFRDLGANVIRVPRIFHNWLHAITLPPPMPSEEAMHDMVEAWTTFRNFFKSVKRTTQMFRLYEREQVRRGEFSGEQEQIKDRNLLRAMGGVVMHLEALGEVPQEFWPFSPDMKVQIAAGKVGQVILRGAQRKTRAVRVQAA